MDLFKTIKYVAIAVFLVIASYTVYMAAKLTTFFPMIMSGDLVAHISSIFFLNNYGFGFIPNWYLGFHLFPYYPPGWAILGWIFYKLSGDYLFAAYFGLIAIYLLSFVGIVLIGLKEKMKYSEVLLFYLTFIFSYIFTGYVLRLGRYPEIMSWMIFIFFFYLVIKYKDVELNITKSFLLGLVFALIILTHLYPVVPAAFLFISLFFVKKKNERKYVVLSAIIALVLASVWLVPFLMNSVQTHALGAMTQDQYGVGTELLKLSSVISTNTVLCILFIILAIWACKTKKDNRFYIPLIILALLLLTRIITVIPIMKSVPPAGYNTFFLFMSLYLIFKLKKYRNVMLIGILLFAIFSFVYTVKIQTPYEYTPLDKEYMLLFPFVKDSFLIPEYTDRNVKLMTFATINYNLSTPVGFHYPEYKDIKLVNGRTIYKYIEELNTRIKYRDCNFIYIMDTLKINDLILTKKDCEFAESCGLKKSVKTKNLCIMRHG